MKRNPLLNLSLILFILFAGLLTACSGTTQPKTYTIGVINYVAPLEAVFQSFKTHMAQLGYEEGRNITYIYHGPVKPEPQAIENENKSLLAQKVDMFLTLGNLPTRLTKKAVEGTHIPVVFAPVVDPLGEGIVDSLTRPAGNVTGVQMPNAAPKAMEWLLKIAPNTKTIYIFYNPRDEVSLRTIQPLPEAAGQLKVELTLTEVQTSEEWLAHLQTLPKDAAVLFIPAPSLETGRDAFTQATIARGIPTGAYSVISREVLFNFGPDPVAEGKQAAQLADRIFKGSQPADLQIENAEFFLTINLKVAQVTGLNISDTILHQADHVTQ